MIIFMSQQFYFLPLFSDSRGMYIFIIRTFREGEGEEEEGGGKVTEAGRERELDLICHRTKSLLFGETCVMTFQI